MLRTLKDLQGNAIRATDGDIGHVKDIYFDDQRWVVRYLIASVADFTAPGHGGIGPQRAVVARGQHVKPVAPG